MDCSSAREDISALLDGERPSSRARELELHLAACAECRAWRERAHMLTRRTRLGLATPAPVPERALAAVRAAASARRSRVGSLTVARTGLVVLAALQAVIAFPELVLGSDRGAPIHVAHEEGSFELALAIGFAVCALRPQRARGMRPLAGAIALLLALTAVIDLILGRTTLLDEAPHLVAIAGWMALVATSRLAAGGGGASAHAPEAPDAPDASAGAAARQVPAIRHDEQEMARRLGRAAKLGCIAAAAAALLAAAPAPSARADGDPGSDVLVYQSLFAPSDAGISIAAQVALGNMLHAAAAEGFPIRVAIIAHPDDLGAITALWGKPAAYARFLGIELSLAYRQRLLVVMPNGLGFYWQGHESALPAAYRVLAQVPLGGSGGALTHATEDAVRLLASAAGVRLSGAAAAIAGSASGAEHASLAGIGDASAGAGQPGGSSGAASGASQAPAPGGRVARGGDETVGLVTVGLLLALAGALAGRHDLARLARRAGPRARRRVVIGLASVSILAPAVALAALADAASSGTPQVALMHNPVLDPGQRIGGRAPNFTLTDQLGQRVSLSDFRGKVVVLAFIDSTCSTICPLTTQAMLDAEAMLGPRADAHVQLLGVDANPKETAIQNVLSYTQLHGLLGRWAFLTGSLSALRHVWARYGIEAEINAGLISHTPALFLISPSGMLARVFLTQSSYAAVPQLGQLLAQRIAALLPDHPHVDARLSYAYIRGISPRSSTALRLARGNGVVRFGPAHAHLVLFFATWDRELTSIAGEMVQLDSYQRRARALRLPPPVAVDVAPTEPSPRALPSFLATLPRALDYPVAVDRTGRLADGYGITALPTLELVKGGRILWYSNVTVAPGWPSAAALMHDVREALADGARTILTPGGPGAAAALRGSPAELAALHAQAGRLLGSADALFARIRSLRGYPVVLNVWASWCGPCQAEFSLLAKASLRYGRQVAFLGADTDDSAMDASAFLRSHHVSYPSYQDSQSQLTRILPQGVEGLPTTIYLSRSGRVAYVHTGQYDSLGTLYADIRRYALNEG